MVQLAELQRIDNILLSGRRPRGGASISSLETKKKRLERNIEVRALRYYQRIRERYDDAVVPIDEQHCSGCGMQITPLMKQEVRRGIGFNNCGCCGRILMWEAVK